MRFSTCKFRGSMRKYGWLSHCQYIKLLKHLMDKNVAGVVSRLVRFNRSLAIDYAFDGIYLFIYLFYCANVNKSITAQIKIREITKIN